MRMVQSPPLPRRQSQLSRTSDTASGLFAQDAGTEVITFSA